MTDKTGKQIAEERWELPKRFQLTKEMLAEADAAQAELAQKANLPYGNMSPTEYDRARSVKIAEDLRFALNHVGKQIGAVLIGGQGDLKVLREAERALRHQLAERYAIFGRYDLACEVEPDPEYQKHYARIVEAVWREDDEKCDCPESHGAGEFADITSSQRVADSDIWSLKHGKMVTLMRCNACGDLNAVETPVETRRLREARAKAQQLVGDVRNPVEAARILTHHGHTSKNLLK